MLPFAFATPSPAAHRPAGLRLAGHNEHARTILICIVFLPVLAARSPRWLRVPLLLCATYNTRRILYCALERESSRQAGRQTAAGKMWVGRRAHAR